MRRFADLLAAGRRLYRGSHGAPSRATMALAVGPVRAVAEFICNENLDVAPQLRDEVFAYFRRALTQPSGTVEVAGAPQGEVLAHVPGQTLAQRIDFLLQIPGVARNVFSAFEHVLYEPEAQINAPRTARLLESVSRDPRIAILYAYGIDPEAWFDHQVFRFWRGTVNQDAFVAILPESRGLDENTALQYVRNIAAPDGLTIDEARRRMIRDSEILLIDAVSPTRIVDLPEFDEHRGAESLDRAAEALVSEGVATW